MVPDVTDQESAPAMLIAESVVKYGTPVVPAESGSGVIAGVTPDAVAITAPVDERYCIAYM
jgi:hypothetical protein